MNRTFWGTLAFCLLLPLIVVLYLLLSYYGPDFSTESEADFW
jgi:hypothetical protein